MQTAATIVRIDNQSRFTGECGHKANKGRAVKFVHRMTNKRRKLLLVRVAEFVHGLQCGTIAAAAPKGYPLAGYSSARKVGNVRQKIINVKQ